MVQKVVKKLSFIGGSLVPKGAVVNFPDEKLKPRSERENSTVSARDDNKRVANSNLADAQGARAIATAAVAPIAPTGPRPVMPQQLPAGTVEAAGGHYNDGYKLVAEGSELAANPPEPSSEDVIEEEGVQRTGDPLDHDGDGQPGGSAPSPSGEKTVADIERELAEADEETIASIERIEAERATGARVGVTKAIEKRRAELAQD